MRIMRQQMSLFPYLSIANCFAGDAAIMALYQAGSAVLMPHD